jgi:hypothetical protein
MLDSIGDESDILKWLVRFSEDKITEGRSWDIRADLLKFGAEVFREEFAGNSLLLAERISNKNSLEAFRKSLTKEIVKYENTLRELGERAVNILTDHGITDNDLFQKKRGVGSFFKKLSRG